MKVHFEGACAGGGIDAVEAWKQEGLIPYKTKSCTGLMMKKGNEKFFTDDMDRVTCGLCIRRWNKFARENNQIKGKR